MADSYWLNQHHQAMITSLCELETASLRAFSMEYKDQCRVLAEHETGNTVAFERFAARCEHATARRRVCERLVNEMFVSLAEKMGVAFELSVEK